MLRLAASAATALAWSLLSAPIPVHATSDAPTEPRTSYGITTIVGIENHTTGTVDVMSLENTQGAVRAQPGKTAPAHINIPWCISQSDFEGLRYIRMTGQPGGWYYLWQSNESWQDRVRMVDKPWWKASAAPVPGASDVNGERILVVNADHTISLRRP